MAYNMLRPNKKLSQLIAKSWMDGTRLKIDKQWLLDNGLISKDEAPFYSIVVDENPQPNPSPKKRDGTKYIGRIELTQEGKFIMHIPYPERPSRKDLPDKDLKEWVDSKVDQGPWVPGDINIWIPYTC